MNTFKKKSLHAAVLAGLCAIAIAGTAEAVHMVATPMVQEFSPYQMVAASVASSAPTSEVLNFNLYPINSQPGITRKQTALPAMFFAISAVQRDNSCAAQFDELGAVQKSKAASYAKTWAMSRTTKWRDMNVTPEAFI